VLAVLTTFGLIALPGCEDEEARQKAGDAARQLNDVKLELAKVTARNEELALKVKGVQDELGRQLTERMDKLSDLVAAQTKDTLEKIISDSQRTRSAATIAADTVRTDYLKDVAALKTTVAADMQKFATK